MTTLLALLFVDPTAGDLDGENTGATSLIVLIGGIPTVDYPVLSPSKEPSQK